MNDVEAMHVSHLLFVDDCLIVCDADADQPRNLLCVFELIFRIEGQLLED